MDKFYRVADVQRLLEVSEPTAYKIMRKLNNELAKMGYITFPGRINAVYFEEKFTYVKPEDKHGSIPRK